MNPNFVNTAPEGQNRLAPRERIVAAACDMFRNCVICDAQLVRIAQKYKTLGRCSPCYG